MIRNIIGINCELIAFIRNIINIYLHWFASAFVGFFDTCIETEMEWTANRCAGCIALLFSAFVIRSVIRCCCWWWVPIADFFFTFSANVRSVWDKKRNKWIQFGVNLMNKKNKVVNHCKFVQSPLDSLLILFLFFPSKIVSTQNHVQTVSVIYK